MYGWKNVCTTGCIDGHRGARCHEFCANENCKSCGFRDNNKRCTACYDGYQLGQNNVCTLVCPSTCESCSPTNGSCDACKKGFYNGYKHDNLFAPPLNNCTFQCRNACAECRSYNICSQCVNGKFGKKCQKNCSLGCKDGKCLIESGYCVDGCVF